MIKTTNLLKAGAAPLALGLALFATPGFAQAVPQAEPQAEVSTDVIVVTGSRIARPDLESAVPVAVIGSQDIAKDAAINIQDTLAELPQVGIGSSRTNTNFLTAGNGVATVNLRNMGDSRTLVLVNGRRYVAGIAGTSAVDINNIPTDFIDRTDIVTGGSSAVYGSDAIAGVVNFILKRKFDGVQLRAQANVTERADNPKQMISLTAGTNFAGERGSFIGNFTYDNDSGLMSRNRRISAQDCFYDLCGPGAYSSFSPQGRFQLLNGAGEAVNAFNGGSLFSFNTDNSLVAGGGTGFNRNGVRRISTPVERFLGSAILGYDVTEGIRAFTEVTYAQVRSNANIEALPLQNSDIYGEPAIGIPVTNAFLPTQIAALIAARNSDADPANNIASIGFRRRQNEVFSRSNNNRRDTWRVAAGLEGKFGESWHWEASYVYGRLKDDTSSQDIDNARYRNALDSIRLADGSVVCRSESARAEGCVPINIFGFNTASPAASAYVRSVVPKSESITNEQMVWAFNVSNNSLFTLPAGGIGLSVGAEYRKEKSVDDLDTLTNTGGNSGNRIPDTVGEFNVKELYGEVNVPVLKDSFVKYFGLIGAARMSDYSQGKVGTVYSWNVGAELEPVDGIKLRGVYARANRAPNISEFASAPAETFAGVNDPCDGVTATSNRQYDAACRAIPQIAKQIAANGVFKYSLADIQGINGFVGGNPDLREETAQTLTLGAVVTPRGIRGLGLTVDYFDIKVERAIGTTGRNESVAQCLQTGNPVFCNNVIRNANTGFVATVNDQLINVANRSTKGVDVGLRYAAPWEVMGGRFDLSANYTHLLSFKTQSNPIAPAKELSGTIYYPENKATARIGFAMPEGFSASWQINYLSGGIADIDLLSDEGAAPFNKVEPRFYHDAQIRFDTKDKKYGFYIGVDNVFDTNPPFLPGTPFTGSPTGTETAADLYDPFGRRYYVGIKASL